MSIIAIVYTSLVALVQEDMKKLIAYSSVAHMGFVTMGLFAMNQQGVQGAIFQMVSHGLVSGALFLCVGVVYDRLHTRDISAYGGVARNMPLYAVALMVFTMANVGLPGTSGFVGEFLTLLGAFRANSWVAFFATTGVILSAAYALYLYRRIAFGVLDKKEVAAMPDLSTREIAVLGSAAAADHLVWRQARPDSRRLRGLGEPAHQELRRGPHGHENRRAGAAVRVLEP
jgi:NADH-quinone oxidoreductase subunit M